MRLKAVTSLSHALVLLAVVACLVHSADAAATVHKRSVSSVVSGFKNFLAAVRNKVQADLIPDGSLVGNSSNTFLSNHFANLSPYHVRSETPPLSTDLPAGCSVDQVHLVHRHGNRLPIKFEEAVIETFSVALQFRLPLLQNLSNPLPAEWDFLRTQGWKNKVDFSEGLTDSGRRVVYQHGQECVVFLGAAQQSHSPLIALRSQLPQGVPWPVDVLHHLWSIAAGARVGPDVSRMDARERREIDI